MVIGRRESFYKQHALIQWSSAEGKVFYKQHALIQWSSAEGKVFYKQHALIQWSSVEGKVFYKQHALKGQKLLAQGNALGYHERKPVAL